MNKLDFKLKYVNMYFNKMPEKFAVRKFKEIIYLFHFKIIMDY